MNTIGNLFYGSYWRIEADKQAEATAVLSDILDADGTDFSDLVDDLSETHDAMVAYHDDGTRTIYWGWPVGNVNEGDNDFDEMALMRVMDLSKGVLRPNVKESVRNTLEQVPYKLREYLSSPGFYVAWESS